MSEGMFSHVVAQISISSQARIVNLSPVVQNLMKLLANLTLKFPSWNMANTLIFYAEKKWVAFALQKLLTFLQQKYQGIWKYLSYNS